MRVDSSADARSDSLRELAARRDRRETRRPGRSVRSISLRFVARSPIEEPIHDGKQSAGFEQIQAWCAQTVERQNGRKRGDRGYDAGKKTLGRRRHVIVDTLGLIFTLVVHPANIQDRDGAKLLIQQLGTRFRRLEVIFADEGCVGKFVHWTRGWYFRVMEIVERKAKGRFAVLPKRWNVERTFALLGKYRRHPKDYETLIERSESMIRLAMINLMTGQLCRRPRAW